MRRLALYGTALLILWGGFRWHSELKSAATASDAPYRRISVFKGAWEAGTLRAGLEESGSSKEETDAIIRSLRRIGAHTHARKGDAYRIVRSTEGAFRHLTATRGRQRVIVTREDDVFKALISKQTASTITRSINGRIKSSLWLSMSALNAPAEIIQEYAEVFQWTVDFLTEPRDGDAFAVAWLEERTPDGRVWSREIQAARYNGKKTGAHIGILFDGQYFNEDGKSLRTMFLRAPLNFRRISSYFSRKRWHPVLRVRRPHNGIDYAAPRGTPVVSVGSGRVTAVGRLGGYGKRIEIRHNGVYATLYGHLNSYARGMSPGRHVRQGEVIGYVGSTGLASGPHLHFQISKNGSWVNFLRLQLPKLKSVSVKEKSAFFARRDSYLPVISEAPDQTADGAQ